MKNLICVLLILMICYSCGSSEFIVNPNGDNVEIVLISRNHYEGELIAITDEEMIINLDTQRDMKGELTGNKIASAKLNKIENVTVEEYSDSWATGVLFMQIIPALFLGLEASAYTGSSSGLIFGLMLMIPGAITSLVFDSASPDPPSWNKDFGLEEIKKLKIYARMPNGINKEQLSELLTLNKQTELFVLK